MMDVALYVCEIVVQVLEYPSLQLITNRKLRKSITMADVVQLKAASWSVSCSLWTRETQNESLTTRDTRNFCAKTFKFSPAIGSSRQGQGNNFGL